RVQGNVRALPGERLSGAGFSPRPESVRARAPTFRRLHRGQSGPRYARPRTRARGAHAVDRYPAIAARASRNRSAIYPLRLRLYKRTRADGEAMRLGVLQGKFCSTVEPIP